MKYYLCDSALLLLGSFFSMKSGNCIYLIYSVGVIITHHLCEFHRMLDAVWESCEDDEETDNE